ncbi:MAG: hypothetical protein HOH58_11350 [Opitutaceae bacterium]|nr:hypothetical protein [Opitutaceae bacterium]
MADRCLLVGPVFPVSETCFLPGDFDEIIRHKEFLQQAYRCSVGYALGGALRWQDEAATGCVQIVDPTIGVIPDITRPFYDDGLFSGDAWISYRRPLANDKINWQIQLNVRNLIGERGNIPVKTNPDGRVAVVRTPNPRTIYLSNTFKF